MKTVSIILALMLGSMLSFAQTTITGNVIDTDGYQLPGVNVSLKNMTIKTVTDFDGKYSISVSNDSISNILIFSFIGYMTQEVDFTGKTVVNVILESDSPELEEVMVMDAKTSVYSVSKEKKSNRGVGRQVYAAPTFAYTVTPVTAIYGGGDDNGGSTEEYDNIVENAFKNVTEEAVSTLSIDVDNASYSNVRRYIESGTLPPGDAVRIEEMINYFSYDYPNPEGEHPFSFVTEMAECPWDKEHKLVHVGIQGKKLDYQELKSSNLVFLLDVSGSMEAANKLPLLRKSFKLLVNELGQGDMVSIVVYAGAAGVVLEPTPATDKVKIFAALDKLHAGGSTAGGAGIEMAYKLAKDNLITDGNNRVILATDGDFNVGTSSTGSLVDLIEEKRKDNIYLTILGFGMGNYKDGRMEQISNAGNGNYFYIDSEKEADKVFVKEMRANMFTIAKDVKIQIEFNPAKVQSYRLIGYENRLLNKEDFNDDTKDAGELGAGHTVTALYEIVPHGVKNPAKSSDKLKYQETTNTSASAGDEVMTLKFRYKPIDSEKSILIEKAVKDENTALSASSDNFRFSASVAAFGFILRDSKYKGTADYKMVKTLAEGAKCVDTEGYRADFIKMVSQAEKIK